MVFICDKQTCAKKTSKFMTPTVSPEELKVETGDLLTPESAQVFGMKRNEDLQYNSEV